MAGRRSARSLSYILVAVIAFGVGSATPAFAESGGLGALGDKVQVLATGLAAEITRAIGAETKLATATAEEAYARATYEKANDARQALHDEAEAAQTAREHAHELADDAARLVAAEALRKSAFDERAHADAMFAQAVHQIDLDILKQEVAKEHERASAEEQRIEAEALLAAAKAAEAAAAALEKPAVTPAELAAEAAARTEADHAYFLLGQASHDALHEAFTTEHAERTKAEAAEAAARAAAIDQVRLTNIAQLLGLSCITFDKQPGQIVLSVGPDGTITLRCVALTQP